MEKYVLARKKGMIQLLDEEGVVSPVTVLTLEPSVVLKKTEDEVRGTNRFLIGYSSVKEQKLNKAKKGVFSKYKVTPMRHTKEIVLKADVQVTEGKPLDFNLFNKREKINVRSKSMGRGFAGTVKRHGFARGPMTHGSKNHRLPGSIGGGTFPGRVPLGKRMPGRYGGKQVTTRNLEVMFVDPEKNTIGVKGAVPGKPDTLVEIYR